MLMCFFGHKWGSWTGPLDVTRTVYIYGSVYRYPAKGQSRTCKKCGKMALAAIRGKA